MIPVVFLMQACYEPTEGCLDIEAVNFDASADDNCCCEYPSLNINLSQRFDTLLWFADSSYANNLGQSIQLLEASWYFSEFGLEQSGQRFLVEDTLSLNTLTGSDTTATLFTDDFILVRRSPSSYTVGGFRTGGSFDQLDFRLGLSETARDVLPSSAPENHPLANQAEGLWMGNDTTYAHFHLIVQRDTLISPTPDTLFITKFDLSDQFVQVSGPFSRQTGFDLNFRLEIDYKALFKDVDWQNGDISTWKTAIVANLPEVFTVTQE